MLEISHIELHKERIIHLLKNRQFDHATELVEKLLSINKKRKETKLALDTALGQANNLSKQVEQLVSTNNTTSLEVLKTQSKELKSTIKELELQHHHYQDWLRQTLYELPNVPHTNVPIGKEAADNHVVYQVENLSPSYPTPLPHWDLIKKYDIIDFELGNKLTGAGFPVYKGKGAKLQRALINFFLDSAEKEGYQEVQIPILVNQDSMYATGQLPDKEGQMYALSNEPYYLIPTAEVPITNLYRGQIINTAQLPIRHVGYTPCFRRESGSWGSHVRGLNRLHQFDKVEIVTITLPDNSYQVLENMRQYIESLVQKLKLPYRVLALCTGELGFTAAFTYDIEVLSVGQNKWLEVSSVSNFETYQSHRLQLRYTDKNNHLYLHTLNGSAIALPRIMAALLEYNFTGDRIDIPAVLHPYTGFTYID